MVPVLKDLGFEPFVHYIPYNNVTLDPVVDWVLNDTNRLAVDEMRKRAQVQFNLISVWNHVSNAYVQELVWSQHLVAHRAIQLHTYTRVSKAQRVARRSTAVHTPACDKLQ